MHSTALGLIWLRRKADPAKGMQDKDKDKDNGKDESEVQWERARIVQDVQGGSEVGVIAGPGAGLLAEAVVIVRVRAGAGAEAGACVGVWQSDASHRPF